VSEVEAADALTRTFSAWADPTEKKIRRARIYPCPSVRYRC